MARMLLPMGPRSATAVAGKSDIRDDNVYSSCVLAHGGTGSASLFTVPQGQTIPELKGSVTATSNAHQTSYTDLTTNLQKAGELGNNIGDAAIRGVGITFEPCAYTASTGAPRSFGMTQFEVADVLAKTTCTIRVGTKDQIKGPTWSFPSYGGPNGSIATTATAATVATVGNGPQGFARRLKTPILVERNDTLAASIAVAGSASLAFSVTGSDGQPSLLWVMLQSSVRADVR